MCQYSDITSIRPTHTCMMPTILCIFSKDICAGKYAGKGMEGYKGIDKPWLSLVRGGDQDGENGQSGLALFLCLQIHSFVLYRKFVLKTVNGTSGTANID